MPIFKDVIGSLVSSITNARVMSDIQTVKVAEEYAKHNLLKHFTIPKLVFSDIEMTIPMALDVIEEKTETLYEPIDHEKFNSIAYNESLKRLNLKLPNELSLQFKSEIAKQTQILEQNIRITKTLTPLKNYSRGLISKILDLRERHSVVKGNVKINTETISDHIETILSREFKIAVQSKAIDNLNVIVEAHKLKEQKPENIIYIKLKISEDRVEWIRSENADGEIESKLLPE